MDTLRRRIPFQLGEDDEEGADNEILDEQRKSPFLN